MTKFKKSILIIGILVVVMAASVATALALFATGSIVTDPIELVYALSDNVDHVYDGKPITASGYKLVSGELNTGDWEEVNYLDNRTNVGTSLCDASVKIYDKDGFNVSSKYTIKVEPAVLTVSPRPVRIKLPSQKVIYNGSSVNFDKYEIETGPFLTTLVDGHKVYGSTEASLIEVGDIISDELMPLIFDTAGNNVTSNYKIEFGVGEIEIVQRPITIKPKSYEKTYDGKKLSCNEIEYVDGTLVEGQYAEYEINDGESSFTDAANYETSITSFKIFQNTGDGARVDVTHNYDISSYERGTVKIKARPLTVTAKSGSWVYDGEVHTFENDRDAFTVEGLAENDSVMSVAYSGSQTNVGSSNNHLTSVNLSCAPTNYSVKCIEGRLTVTPCEITVTTGSDEKYFDGTVLKCTLDDGISSTLTNYGHRLGVPVSTVYPSLTNAGTKQNNYQVVVLDRNDEDVSSNYIINYEYGTLTVKKIPVSISFPLVDAVNYNGLERDIDIYQDKYCLMEITDDRCNLDLDDGFKLCFDLDTFGRTVKNVGDYPYTVKLTDRSITRNFDVTVEGTGLYVIEPIRLTLTTDSGSWVYDGTAHSERAFSITGSSGNTLPSEDGVVTGGLIPSGHKIVAPTDVPEITDVGKVTNRFTCFVYDQSGFDASSNYEIGYGAMGILEVTKLNLQFTLEDYEKTFNGRDITLKATDAITSLTTTDTVTLDDVISKEDFSIVYTDGAIQHVKLNASGDVESYAYKVEITDKNLAKNFAVTGNAGKVTVNKLDVDVTIRDIEINYSGEEYVYNTSVLISGISDTSTGLTKETFVVSASGGVPKNVKYNDAKTQIQSYKYTVSISANESDYNLTLKNEDGDTVTEGNVKINPLPVTVLLKDVEKSYDGAEYVLTAKKAISVIHDRSGKLTSSNFSIDGTVKATNVSSIEYTVVLNDDVKYNYVLTCEREDGTAGSPKLEIKKAEITVVISDVSKVYRGLDYVPLISDVVKSISDQTTGVTTAALRVVGEDGNNISDNANVGTYKFSVAFKTTPTYENLVNNHTLKVIRENGTEGFGKFTIEKIKIHVTTDTPEAIEYAGKDTEQMSARVTGYTENGLSLSTSAMTVMSGMVVSGYAYEIQNPEVTLNSKKLRVITTGPYVKLTEVGTAANVFACRLIIGELTDYNYVAESNYEFVYSYGTLSVLKKSIEVTTKSAEFTYDGTEHKLGEIVDCFLTDPLGDYKVEYPRERDLVSITNVGAADNVFAIRIKLLERDDDDNVIGETDVTDCFNVSYTYGELEVKAKDIYVTLKNVLTDYTGKPITLNPASVITKIQHLDGGTRSDYGEFTVNDFVCAYDGTVIDVKIVPYYYSVKLKDASIAKNYNIICINETSGMEGKGKITVNKALVLIDVENLTVTYTGAGQDVALNAIANNPVNADGEAWLPIEYIKVQYQDSAGQNFGAGNLPTAVGTYRMVFSVDTDRLTDDGKEKLISNLTVLFNYANPAVTYALLSIQPVNATVTLKNYFNSTYGTPLTVGDVVVSIDNAEVDNSDLQLTYTSEAGVVLAIAPTNVGTYKVGVRYVGSGVISVTAINADGNLAYCVYNITALNVHVTLKDIVSTYKAEPENRGFGDVVQSHDGSGLLTEDMVNICYYAASAPTVRINPEPVNAGEYIIRIVCKEAYSANFVLSCTGGNYKINKATAVVTTQSAGEETFNGTGYTFNTTDLTVTGLMTGHTYSGTFTHTDAMVNAGTYYNEVELTITDGDGATVTDNYAIDAHFGTLVITPLAVRVEIAPAEGDERVFKYTGSTIDLDGDDFINVSYDGYELDIVKLIDGDAFDLVSDNTIRNAGTYNLSARLKSGVIAGNFAITVVPYEFKVEKARYNLAVNDISNVFQTVYTGEEIVYTSADVFGVIGNGKLTLILEDEEGNEADTKTFRVDQFSVDFKSTVLNAGQYRFDVNFIDEDIAKNIEIINKAGVLHVKPIDVVIELNNFTFTYSGRAVEIDPASAIKTISNSAFTANDFSVVSSGDTIKAGTYTISVEFKDKDNRKNYKVTYTGAGGNVTIEKRTIVITLNSITVNSSLFDDGSFDIPDMRSLVVISSSTPLADGDIFYVKSAMGTCDLETSSMMLLESVHANGVNYDFDYELTNADCYEVILIKTVVISII